MEIVPYEPGQLEALLAMVARAEFSESIVAEPERFGRGLAAPGAIALVAVEDGEPIGFSNTITDGAFQAYLCVLLVDPAARRRGVARALVEATLARCGAIRVDLIATEEAEPFYQRLRHRGPWPGYRLYSPGAPFGPPAEGTPADG